MLEWNENFLTFFYFLSQLEHPRELNVYKFQIAAYRRRNASQYLCPFPCARLSSGALVESCLRGTYRLQQFGFISFFSSTLLFRFCFSHRIYLQESILLLLFVVVFSLHLSRDSLLLCRLFPSTVWLFFFSIFSFSSTHFYINSHFTLILFSLVTRPPRSCCAITSAPESISDQN